jgi:REP element-mobilizing transposase RayT
MSSKYKIHDNDKAYFVTITVVEWVDLFTRMNHKNTIINALKYCQKNKGLEIYAWVLMSNHLHMICRGNDEYHLAAIMRDFKKFTARQIIKQIKEEPESRREWLLNIFSNACGHLKREQEYKVWQNGYHAIEVSSNKFIYQKLNYIHQNPVDAGIVARPEEYIYSSARNYSQLDSLIDVVVIEPELRTY